MIDTKRKILSILDPTIKVIEIKQPETDTDLEKDDETLQPNWSKTKTSSKLGGWAPFIALKKSIISPLNISTFTLNTFGQIPEIVFAFNDERGHFDTEIPMDGDQISLYLKPPDVENQRPIRIDFDLIGMEPIINDDYKSYVIRGIMKIPGFFNDVCKSFPDATSFEHIQDICTEIGLGFASNETSTDDSMTRICPFDSYKEFVNDILKNAYKDDNSFFTWYVDPFYYLCLVNINKQLATSFEPEDINISNSYPTDAQFLEKDQETIIKGKLILSNHPDKKGTNVFINNYAPSGDQGIWLTDGYVRKTKYYDIDTKGYEHEYITNTIEAGITENSQKSFVLQKGGTSGFYKTQEKYNWAGKQEPNSVGGNVHDNFIYSEVLNLQNSIELSKLNMIVEVEGSNFYIYKYMMIPVEIYHNKQEDGTFKKEKFDIREESLGQSDNIKTTTDDDANGHEEDANFHDRLPYLNKYLSGYYLVTGIKYIYSKDSQVKMLVNLTRREHNIPAENNDFV